MDRRSFLVGSALGSVGLAATPGCGGAPLRPELDAHATGELVERLERGLARVRDVPSGAMASAMPWHVRPELSENILRRTIESLLVFDIAGSIPAGTTMPRALSERLAPEWPNVARSTQLHHALLTRMPPAVRRDLAVRARARPTIASEVAGWLDGYAGELGVPTENRLRLRSAAANVATRVRRQSMGAVIDDSVAKVEQAAARSGASIWLATGSHTALIDAMWQQVEGVGRGGGSGDGGGGDGGASRLGAYVPSEEELFVYPEGRRWNASWDRPGDQEQQIGGILMAFFCPSAGILLIAGLIVLIAGSVQNAEWNGESEVERRAREERGS